MIFLSMPLNSIPFLVRIFELYTRYFRTTRRINFWYLPCSGSELHVYMMYPYFCAHWLHMHLMNTFHMCISTYINLYMHVYIYIYIYLLIDLRRYNTVQCDTVQYNTMQYTTVQYNTAQHNTMRYNALQHKTLHYGTLRYITLHYVALHNSP